MRIIKNIHNNISLCLDSKGNEVIAFGKGIGFKKPPYDLPIECIERTFYNVNPTYVNMLADIPEQIIEVSASIIDFANSLLGGKYSNSLIFTLADHINFSIKRNKEKIRISLPLVHEVKVMYPKEIQIGEYSVKLIKDKLGIQLPREEAAVITLHVVEYGINSDSEQYFETNHSKIEKCTELVEKCMNIKINRDSFNYSRFVSHMYFLLDRINKNKPVISENKKMFDKLVEEYPEIYECAKGIANVLEINLNDEELMYLILHINRLNARN